MERCGSSGIFTGSHGTLQDGIRSDRGAVPSDPGEKVWGLGPCLLYTSIQTGAVLAVFIRVHQSPAVFLRRLVIAQRRVIAG